MILLYRISKNNSSSGVSVFVVKKSPWLAWVSLTITAHVYIHTSTSTSTSTHLHLHLLLYICISMSVSLLLFAFAIAIDVVLLVEHYIINMIVFDWAEPHAICPYHEHGTTLAGPSQPIEFAGGSRWYAPAPICTPPSSSSAPQLQSSTWTW